MGRRTRKSREIWVYESAQAVIMKYHRGEDLNNRNVFSHNSEAGKFQVDSVPANSVPGEALFLAYRWPPSHHVLT